MEQLRNFLQASKAQKGAPTRDASQIGNRLHEVFDRMAAQSAMKGKPMQLSTGMEDMDAIIGGLELGELVAIDGLPGSGRIAMALEVVLQAAKDTQLPILIYSQEHSPQQITRRMLSMLTGVPIRNIENAVLEDDQWNALHTASTWLQDQDIRILEIDGSLPELCGSIRGFDTPALVIVDGLPINQLGQEQMRQLKELAREKSCCVVFTCLYNATATYIAGGVDKVFFLNCYADEDFTFEIKWNRNGRNGCTFLTWHESCLCFLPFPTADDGGNG